MSTYKRMYKDSRRVRPSLPITIALKCLVLQYLWNLSDPAIDDALIDRLSFQDFSLLTLSRPSVPFSAVTTL